MNDVDVAFAEEWKFDHGIMVPLHFLTPRFDLPVIPVNINCQGPPLTPLKRAWAFGAALRRACDAVPERIALVGTGGISHWPATPDSGKINEAWDRDFLDRWARNDREALLDYSDAATYRDAGQGGFEIRTFIAVAAAARGRGESATTRRSRSSRSAARSRRWRSHRKETTCRTSSSSTPPTSIPSAKIGALCTTLAEIIVAAARRRRRARLSARRHARARLPDAAFRRRRRRAGPRLRVPQRAHRRGPRARLVVAAGEALIAAVRSHFAAIFASRPVGITLADRRRPAGLRRQAQQPASALRKDAEHARRSDIAALAARAARRARFARPGAPLLAAPSGHDDRRRLRDPARVGEDAARRRARRQGPQDRPHLARDAAGLADRRAGFRAAARRHVLRARRRHSVRSLHRAARRGRARLRPRPAVARPRRDARSTFSPRPIT